MKKPQTMAIPLERITWEGVDIPVRLTPEWFDRWLQDEPGLEFTLATPIQGEVHLERHEGNILLQGRLQGELSFTCSRCLDPFSQPLATSFEMLLKIGHQPVLEAELELGAADLEEEYIPGHALELDAVLREQILLALPLKPLCHEECQGLCRGCGANLNREACSCRAPAGQGNGAPWSKLRE